MMSRPFAVAMQIDRATSAGSAVSRAGSFMPSVMRVLTKPGFTVITRTPLAAKRLRRPDRKAVKPALAEPVDVICSPARGPRRPS